MIHSRRWWRGNERFKISTVGCCSGLTTFEHSCHMRRIHAGSFQATSGRAATRDRGVASTSNAMTVPLQSQDCFCDRYLIKIFIKSSILRWRLTNLWRSSSRMSTSKEFRLLDSGYSAYHGPISWVPEDLLIEVALFLESRMDILNFCLTVRDSFHYTVSCHNWPL